MFNQCCNVCCNVFYSIQEAQIFMLLNFAPHMEYKGDFSGRQLLQESLLQQVLSPPELGSQKVERIMDEWALSGKEDNPKCYMNLLKQSNEANQLKQYCEWKFTCDSTTLLEAVFVNHQLELKISV